MRTIFAFLLLAAVCQGQVTLENQMQLAERTADGVPMTFPNDLVPVKQPKKDGIAPGIHRAIESVCRVTSRGNVGDSVGTGFVFSEDSESIYIQTNAHIAGNRRLRTSCEFWHQGRKSPSVPAKLIWHALYDEYDIDVAILRVAKSEFQGHHIPRPVDVEIGTSRPGDEIVSVGCARGAWPSLWWGHARTPRNANVIEARPPSAGGRSGSPIFNKSGTKILGVVTWRSDERGTTIGQSTQLIAGAMRGKVSRFRTAYPRHAKTRCIWGNAEAIAEQRTPTQCWGPNCPQYRHQQPYQMQPRRSEPQFNSKPNFSYGDDLPAQNPEVSKEHDHSQITENSKAIAELQSEFANAKSAITQQLTSGFNGIQSQIQSLEDEVTMVRDEIPSLDGYATKQDLDAERGAALLYAQSFTEELADIRAGAKENSESIASIHKTVADTTSQGKERDSGLEDSVVSLGDRIKAVASEAGKVKTTIGAATALGFGTPVAVGIALAGWFMRRRGGGGPRNSDFR